MPHQPPDRIGIRLGSEGQFLWAQPPNRPVNDFADPPEGVDEGFCCVHVGSRVLASDLPGEAEWPLRLILRAASLLAPV